MTYMHCFALFYTEMTFFGKWAAELAAAPSLQRFYWTRIRNMLGPPMVHTLLDAYNRIYVCYSSKI